jgi:hypothetical protein
MIAQNDGSQNDFMDFDPMTNFVKVRQLVSLCHPGRAQAVIPEELNLSSRTSSSCHPGPAQSVIPDSIRDPERTTANCEKQRCKMDPGSSPGMTSKRASPGMTSKRAWPRMTSKRAWPGMTSKRAWPVNLDLLHLSSRTRSGIQSALVPIAKSSAAKWIPGLRPG